MVENPGAQKRPGTLRALNEPRPVRVHVDDDGMPRSIRTGKQWYTVNEVVDRWRLQDEWWRETPLDRMYFECLLDDGLRVVVFRNMNTGEWYSQRGAVSSLSRE